MIKSVSESLSGVGGVVVVLDNGNEYHWYEGMRKTPQSLAVGQAVRAWKKPIKSAADAKAEIEKAEKDFQQKAEADKLLREKARDKKIKALAKELEAGNFAALAEIVIK